MKSIAFKLWSGMMLLVIVVLLLLWFFQIVFLESFYTRQRVLEVRDKGISVVNDMNDMNEEELIFKLDSFVHYYNCSVELMDKDGTIIYSNGPGMQTPMVIHNFIKRNVFLELMSGKIIISNVNHPRFGTNYMVIGIPSVQDGIVSRALLISMPLAPVKDTADILKKQLVYVMCGLFLAALVLSYVISRSFIKPLLNIKMVTERMAAGDLAARIKIKSQDEIGELSKSVNFLGEEISKIEQLRRDFVANVSHELRTPLSLIRGYAETIKDVTGNNERKREKQLEIIIDESERLSNIVNDILDLSRIQTGNLKLDITMFDLNMTINSVITRYDIFCDANDMSIIYNNSDSVMVTGDEVRIEQVLFNLINNALNFSSKGSSITISVKQLIDKVRVEISDTGKGIAVEDMKYIWERYYKAEKDGHGRIGTGLGLAIVKSILEAHNSRFGIESVTAKGTTFWFEMPCHI